MPLPAIDAAHQNPAFPCFLSIKADIYISPSPNFTASAPHSHSRSRQEGNVIGGFDQGMIVMSWECRSSECLRKSTSIPWDLDVSHRVQGYRCTFCFARLCLIDFRCDFDGDQSYRGVVLSITNFQGSLWLKPSILRPLTSVIPGSISSGVCHCGFGTLWTVCTL